MAARRWNGRRQMSFKDFRNGGGGGWFSPWGNEDMHEPAHAVNAPPPLTTPPPARRGLSNVAVPFDPEDQSDDEVITMSAYERRMVAGGKGKTDGAKDYDGNDAISAGAKTKEGHSQGRLQDVSTASQEAEIAGPPPIPLVPRSNFFGQPQFDVSPGSVYQRKRINYCPWPLVANYHLWFVGKVNGERIQPYFALDELLRSQIWDFCYVWHPDPEPRQTYILLVPTEQVQCYLERVNATLNIRLTIPAGDIGARFQVGFGSHQTPVPRFLGQASTQDEFRELCKSIPPLHPKDAIHDQPNMTERGRRYYEGKVRGLIYDGGKNAKKKNKIDKNKRRRCHDRKLWGRQTKRIQRYMGLRQRTAKNVEGADPLAQLDLLKPVPFAPEDDILFVTMDIESYEYNHNALTEIGFAILDTRDVVSVPPGDNGANWHNLIQARHIRIRENAGLVNRTFVQGCENNFNFGESEFVPLKQVLALVTSILQPKALDGTTRKVLLVGHDIRSDIHLVKKIGFHVEDGMFFEVVDTQYVYQHFRWSTQQAGLRAVLRDLEIKNSFLHNAGNDAVYTLQALITIVLRQRLESLRKQTEQGRPSRALDGDAVEQGWVTGGELSDGGHVDDEVAFDDIDRESYRDSEVAGWTPSLPPSQPPSRVSHQASPTYQAWPAASPPPPTPVAGNVLDETDDLIAL